MEGVASVQLIGLLVVFRSGVGHTQGTFVAFSVVRDPHLQSISPPSDPHLPNPLLPRLVLPLSPRFPYSTFHPLLIRHRFPSPFSLLSPLKHALFLYFFNHFSHLFFSLGSGAPPPCSHWLFSPSLPLPLPLPGISKIAPFAEEIFRVRSFSPFLWFLTGGDWGKAPGGRGGRGEGVWLEEGWWRFFVRVLAKGLLGVSLYLKRSLRDEERRELSRVFEVLLIGAKDWGSMAGSNEVNASESKNVVPLNTWVLISNFKLAYNLLRRPDGSFDRHLAEFLDRKVPANATPVDGVFSFDVLIDRPTNLLSRVYRPAPETPLTTPAIISEIDRSPSATPFPVIIFFHGGSFSHSSSNSAIYDSLCRRFVSICNAVVISVNYRRSPEYRYPCAYEDGWAAVKWAASRPWLRSGSDSKVRIFLAGDSSGGNIAHHVAVKSIGSGIQVYGNILMNSMFGGEERKDSELRFDGKYFVTLQDRDWYWKAFLPEGADRNHPACSPFGPNGISLEGLPFPKSLIAVAGFDLTRDWQLAYAEGLKKAKQEVKLLYLEQATIGFYLLPNNDHFFVLMDEIKKFVNADC